jgi:ubiquinone/menaquinone biosynthesis C-methylase UbiE
MRRSFVRGCGEPIAPDRGPSVDISAEMVQRARSRAVEEGVSNVAFERGDAQIHPFPAAHFDLIISRFGTMFFADPVSAFTHLARAARPGAPGHVGVAE